MTIQDVPVDDGQIRLAQFLKYSGAADSGGEARMRIADGDVSVNGEVEVRRGRQLAAGDVVAIDGQRLRVQQR